MAGLPGMQPAVRTAHVGYNDDHPSDPARAALDRPDPGRRCRRSHHAPSDRGGAGRRSVPLRGHIELAVPQRQPIRIPVPKRHGPDPHRRSRHCGAERDSESCAKSHFKCGRDDGRSDRGTDNSGTDSAEDKYAGADPHADEDALGPAQLRDDRRELAHRIAGHRDVADAQALAAFQ